MQKLVRSVLLGALALSPAAALAQGLVIQDPVVEEDPLVLQSPVVVTPMMGADGVMEEDARMIAMGSGMVTVEDVDRMFWNGNYEVEGSDAAGNDMEITIDGETGAVLEIDD